MLLIVVTAYFDLFVIFLHALPLLFAKMCCLGLRNSGISEARYPFKTKCTENETDAFYCKLKQTLSKTKKHKLNVRMGNF